jgi:plastocyanin
MKLLTIKLMVVSILVGGLLAGVTGAASSATSVVRAGKNSAGAFVWKPASKGITKGNRVQWRNPTGVTHNVRAYGGNWSYSKNLAPGARVARTFKRRGTFRYRCTIHSVKTTTGCTGMCGKVTVS